jgi:hypothetical protein
MQLMVLGMHRSGTSVLARLLNLMGVYFAPEGASTGANRENPKGFWERRDVRVLNDMVLHSAGCDWNRVSDFAIEAVPQAVITEFKTRASTLVLEMDAHRPWFMKEPRLCLLLPLWLEVLESPICINIFRNPLEVASSLRTRNDIPIESGLALWERYVRSALRASAGLPSLMVLHRELMQDPVGAATKLHARLGEAGVRGLRLPSDGEIRAFVREDLYREREGDPLLAPFADSPQVAMFDRLASGAAEPDELVAALAPASRKSLTLYESSLAPLPPPRDKEPKQTEAALRQEIALKAQEVALVRDMLGQSEGALKQHADLIAQLNRELGSANAIMEERGSELEQLRASTKQYEERVSLLDRDLAALRARAETREAEVQQQLTQAKDRAAVLEGDLGKMRALGDAREAELQLQLQQAKDAAAALAAAADAELQQARETAAALAAAADTELQQTKETAVALERDLGAMRELLKKQDADLAVRQSELDAERKRAERIAPLEEELIAARQATAARFQEIAQLTRMLRDREIANAALETQRTRVADDARKLAGQARVLRAAAKEAQARLSQQDADLRQLRLQLFGQDKRLALRESELARLKSSKSWKMTALLRKLRGGGTSSAVAPEDLELVRVASLFDADWYLEQNPDVAEAGLDPAEHYLLHGASEGRDPGPWFSTAFYLANYPDVAAAGTNPLVHFVRHGSEEGRACRSS